MNEYSRALENGGLILSRHFVEVKISEEHGIVFIAKTSIRTGQVFIEVGIKFYSFDRKAWQFLIECFPVVYRSVDLERNCPLILVTPAGLLPLEMPASIPLKDFDLTEFLKAKKISDFDKRLIELRFGDAIELLVSEASPFIWATSNPIALYCLCSLINDDHERLQISPRSLSFPLTKVNLVKANLLATQGLPLSELDRMLNEWIHERRDSTPLAI